MSWLIIQHDISGARILLYKLSPANDYSISCFDVCPHGRHLPGREDIFFVMDRQKVKKVKKCLEKKPIREINLMENENFAKFLANVGFSYK